MQYDENATKRPEPIRLIGRKRERGMLRHLLAGGGLTTVTGPAGIGKSALAIGTVAHLGNALQRRLVVAQWWRPGPVPDARERLCEAAGLPADMHLGELGAALTERPTLLLLDDVDPCRSAVARLVQHLLMQQPRLRVLVTSRAPLGLGAEHVLPLGPLPSDEGILLYRSLSSDRQRCDDSALISLCSALDNNPLAIVHAARRGTPSGMQERHTSTYRAEAEGACLLESDERTVWARLSVLPGSFDTTTALALAAHHDDRTQINVGAALARLHQHSVLQAERDPGAVRGPRYRLTSSPRVWGMVHLQERGESRRAARCMQLRAQVIAAEARRLWHLGHQRQALDIVDEDWPLLNAVAEEPSLDVLSREAAFSVSSDLWFWWMTRGSAQTGLRLLQYLLHHSDGPSYERCEALTLASHLAMACHDASAQTLLNQAWDAVVEHGSRTLLGTVLTAHAYQAVQRQRWGEARQLLRSADLLAPAAPTNWTAAPSIGQGWSHLAAALATTRQLDQASYALERALHTTNPDRDAWAHTHLFYAQAVQHQHHGRTAAAWRACQIAHEAAQHYRFADLHRQLQRLTTALLEENPALRGLVPAPRLPREPTRQTGHGKYRPRWRA
ncbi:hypothetical protein [Streptomyces sp. NPDC096934]|uniref:hypothetical protein n=1 Tax=Streptomyces sp. NPDC096934 TaxID=3155551 RepID=UPI0033319F87